MWLVAVISVRGQPRHSLRTLTLALARMVPCLLVASHWNTALSCSCRLVRLISLVEILPRKVLPGKQQIVSGLGGSQALLTAWKPKERTSGGSSQDLAQGDFQGSAFPRSAMA